MPPHSRIPEPTSHPNPVLPSPLGPASSHRRRVAPTVLLSCAGILFTKISLDTFGGVYDDAMADLGAVLARPPCLKQLTRGGLAGAESPLLQLGAITVFSAHVAGAGVPESSLRCAQAERASYRDLRPGQATQHGALGLRETWV